MTTRITQAIRGLLIIALTLVAAAVLADPAAAANQSTLDHGADSMGPIVVDQSGNGYVAWLHAVGAGDTDMFCKLPAGTTKCAHPITLPVTLPTPASTDTPFPVLGPGSDVYVVAPSYDSSQMVIWESTDGGATFRPAYVGPTNAILADGLDYTDTCNVALDLDDVLPFNAYGGEYDRSQGTSTLGSSTIEFEMSSAGPSAMWSFDFDGSGCYVSSSVTVTPGKIPAQWFTQGGDHSGVSGVSTDQSTLGWAGGGTVACSLNAPGDEVQAYQVGDSSLIRFFRWSTPTGPCGSDPGVNVGPSGADNWSGPSTVTNGQYPRLAGGKAGLFLLSGDDPGHAGAPTAVDIRPYELASHSFGAAERLATVHNPSGLDADWGGLGESYTSGELAAVWPDVSGDDGIMSLFISTDGGAHFSGGQAIGHVGPGFAGNDNARVAVAADGAGYVTWKDGSGLHVADLEPLASAYERLKVSHSTLDLPVTCEAPKGSCDASAVIRAKGFKIADGHRTVPSGATKTLVLRLNGNGDSLLSKARHHHLKALLTLKITHSPIKTERLSVHSLIVK